MNTTDIEAPRGLLTFGEVRLPMQIPRLLFKFPQLATAPRSDGAPCILIPGVNSSERPMIPLLGYLRFLGHDAHNWGFGVNTPADDGKVEHISERIRRLEDRTSKKVAIVGWSYGGTVAREYAREHPERVRSVVTFGTPAVGGAKFTRAAASWPEVDYDRIETEIETLNREKPLRVPVTAIWSRNDGIVAGRAQIDPYNDVVKHIEVKSTHAGMTIDPDVWLATASALSPADS